jgi:hypothetical protein
MEKKKMRSLDEIRLLVRISFLRQPGYGQNPPLNKYALCAFLFYPDNKNICEDDIRFFLQEIERKEKSENKEEISLDIHLSKVKCAI